MPSYQDIFTQELNEAFAAAKAADASKKQTTEKKPATDNPPSSAGSKNSASNPTEKEYSNLLETAPESPKSSDDFEQFARILAAKLSENKENLRQEDAQRDANEVLKIMHSGSCGGIRDPQTLTQLMNAVGSKPNEPKHQDLGIFTRMVIKAEEKNKTSSQQQGG